MFAFVAIGVLGLPGVAVAGDVNTDSIGGTTNGKISFTQDKKLYRSNELLVQSLDIPFTIKGKTAPGLGMWDSVGVTPPAPNDFARASDLKVGIKIKGTESVGDGRSNIHGAGNFIDSVYIKTVAETGKQGAGSGILRVFFNGANLKAQKDYPVSGSVSAADSTYTLWIDSLKYNVGGVENIILAGGNRGGGRDSVTFRVSHKDRRNDNMKIESGNGTYTGSYQGLPRVTWEGFTPSSKAEVIYHYSRHTNSTPGGGAGAVFPPLFGVNERGEKVDSLDTLPNKILHAGKYNVQVFLKDQQDTAFKSLTYTVERKQLTAGVSLDLQGASYVFDSVPMQPGFVVKDGAAVLEAGIHYTGGFGLGSGDPDRDVKDSSFSRNVNAGSAKVKIVGIGDYAGSLEAQFNIAKKVINVNGPGIVVKKKAYDGTTAFSADSVTSVEFFTISGYSPLEKGKDYEVSNLILGSPDVGRTTLSGTVRLLGTDKAKNYELGDASFSVEGEWVTARSLTTADLKFPTPLPIDYYNGTARGVPDIDWAFQQPNRERLVVRYGIANSNSWWPVDSLPYGSPTQNVSYDILVTVDGDNISNFTRANTSSSSTAPQYSVILTATTAVGKYQIRLPAEPNFVTNLSTTNKTIKQGKVEDLRVVVTSPSGDDASLSYQWYKKSKVTGVPDEELGSTTNTYTPPTDGAVGTFETYYVIVTNDPGEAVHLPVTKKSNEQRVTVGEPAISLKDAIVEVKGTYVYSGDSIKPKGTDIAVKLFNAAGTQTTLGTSNYIVSYAYNLNAGTGLVYAVGTGNYEDTAIGTFVIDRKKLVKNDMDFSPKVATYSGDPVEVKVIGVKAKTTEALGIVAVSYGDNSEPQSNVDKYSISVRVTPTSSSNFDVPDDTTYVLGDLTINKATVNKAGLQFNANRLEPDSVLLVDAAAGIGSVELLKGTGAGEITVKYDNKLDIPTALGRYLVTATLTGGENYFANVINLGYYKIVEALKYAVKFTKPANGTLTATVDGKAFTSGTPVIEGTEITFTAKPSSNRYAIRKWTLNGVDVADNVEDTYTITVGTDPVDVGVVFYNTGIAETERVIPTGNVTVETAVAPVAKAVAAFTAGPSPASKAAGKIAFFSKNAVKSGSLYVFDASGNAVAKIAAKSGSGEVATWNLKDSKGAAVAEGTYIVKGALTAKDGTREKVAFVFSVVK
jgi:hypothetical protein